jgi:hypothetical protein
MNAELKQKWLAALRSGEYKQCRTSLRKQDNSFCCLGVLYDVSGTSWEPRQDFGDYISSDGEVVFLSEEMLAATGISQDEQNILWRMNDRDRASFSEIADYIEQHL